MPSFIETIFPILKTRRLQREEQELLARKKQDSVWSNRTLVWYLNGKLHRDNGDDGPAGGTHEWYFEGKYHRGKAENWDGST